MSSTTAPRTLLQHFSLAIVLALLSATAMAAPRTYQLDPNHTQVLVRWEHFGFSHPSANFGQAEGTLVYDADDVPASSVNVLLPLSGLDTFVPALDKHLRGEDFFDAEQYPVITFDSTKVETAGEGKLKVTGDLTIKGVTKVVVLDVTLNKVAVQPMTKRPAIGFDATATIKRSDFGIDKFVPNVSDDITLRITTEASVPASGAGK